MRDLLARNQSAEQKPTVAKKGNVQGIFDDSLKPKSKKKTELEKKIGDLIHKTPHLIVDPQNHVLKGEDDNEWEDIGEEEDVVELDPKPTLDELMAGVEEAKGEDSFTKEDLEALKAIQREKPEALNEMLAQESAECLQIAERALEDSEPEVDVVPLPSYLRGHAKSNQLVEEVKQESEGEFKFDIAQAEQAFSI